MAFDTQNNRAGAMGDLLMPMHPVPDAGIPTQADRQMVTGIYPGILVEIILETKLCLTAHVQSLLLASITIQSRKITRDSISIGPKLAGSVVSVPKLEAEIDVAPQLVFSEVNIETKMDFTALVQSLLLASVIIRSRRITRESISIGPKLTGSAASGLKLDAEIELSHRLPCSITCHKCS